MIDAGYDEIPDAELLDPYSMTAIEVVNTEAR